MRKIILSIYLIGFILLSVFFVPQSNFVTIYSQQRVPHKIAKELYYAPLWHYYYISQNGTVTLNDIRYGRYFFHLGIFTIIVLGLYFVFALPNKKNN